ncbi:MAG: PfkB family carbohydrate kinase [Armatimonadota bacterium]|nr:PfkB family carbohydrate kinase [Armatimonadota bacterium]
MTEQMETVGYDALSVDRLETIIARWRRSRIAVVGDFFLDRYLIIDPELTEPSLETGLDAYQVVEKRPQPGAAGTVAGNLVGLEMRGVFAVGFTGDDGEGFELRQAMDELGLHSDGVVTAREMMTPTYTKPLVREEDGSLRELNRLDIRNRRPIPTEIEDEIIERVRWLAGEAAITIISDQEDDPELGVVTPRVVDALAEIGQEYPDGIWVDSRGDISRFRNCIIKPNASEACRAAGVELDGEPTLEQARQAGERLLEQTNSWTVVVTVGGQGVVVVTDEAQPFHVPAVRVEGEIDIVGAGDSFTAGMASTLAIRGTSLDEAAIVGNLVASITIQQIGTTGTASPEQVLQRLEDVHAGRMPGA